jgi:hypothetical protein
MNRQLFFLDADGSGALILTIKKDKVFIATENDDLECLEPERLMTAIFWEMLDQKLVLIGDL